MRFQGMTGATTGINDEPNAGSAAARNNDYPEFFAGLVKKPDASEIVMNRMVNISSPQALSANEIHSDSRH